MSSIQNKLLRGLLKTTGKNKKVETHSVKKARKQINRLTLISTLPLGVSYERINCNGISCEWIIPKNVNNKGVVLYFHGGAYVSGSIDTHRGLVARIAKASKTACLSVDYRLAPEHPFPAGLEDAITIYNWLILQGYNHKKIIIAGDSAGGGLAIAALLKLRDDNALMPLAAVCMSPWLDLECTGDSGWKLVKKDPMLKVEFGKVYANYYAPDQDLKHPYISPYYANLQGLPSIYIQVSDSELILDDSTRFAEKAKAVGVDVSIEIWKQMVHVWQVFSPILPEATKAIQKIGNYIEAKLAEEYITTNKK
jgi:monoterpene epsilon-lactone hydrolase